jgi:hypothetical protein
VARSRSHFVPAINFQPAFDYYAVINAAAKIDSVPAVIAQVDAKRLFGLQRHEKLDCVNGGKATVFPPAIQCREHFVQNQYAWHERRVRKMPRQTGMISANRSAHFKGHVSKDSIK